MRNYITAALLFLLWLPARAQQYTGPTRIINLETWQIPVPESPGGKTSVPANNGTTQVSRYVIFTADSLAVRKNVALPMQQQYTYDLTYEMELRKGVDWYRNPQKIMDDMRAKQRLECDPTGEDHDVDFFPIDSVTLASGQKAYVVKIYREACTRTARYQYMMIAADAAKNQSLIYSYSFDVWEYTHAYSMAHQDDYFLPNSHDPEDKFRQDEASVIAFVRDMFGRVKVGE